MAYLIKFLQFIQQQGQANQTKYIENMDLWFKERGNCWHFFFGRITLKINRTARVAKCQEIYGNVAGSQQDSTSM